MVQPDTAATSPLPWCLMLASWLVVNMDLKHSLTAKVWRPPRFMHLMLLSRIAGDK
jgi:hypothetical protein